VVQGLSHMTFVVRDLDRMEEILTRVLDARKVYDSGDATFSLSRERFFLVGEGPEPVWSAIMEGEPLPARSYNHVAFRVEAGRLGEYSDRIAALGLPVREARSRVEGEGQSIYFHDEDNHLFELHAGTLEDRLARYARGPG
jgi:catechol 2,3-dioxygenase-like lactoylglutathione lyase family enzyme